MTGNACPVCRRAYSWDTTGPFGIGLIKAVHPPGPCIAPPPVVYEPEEERECTKCGRGFLAKGRHEVCVGCRAEQKRRAARELHRKRSPVRNLEPRPCSFCLARFKPGRRWQEACGSTECKKAYWRKYQQQRRAAGFGGELRKYLKRKVA